VEENRDHGLKIKHSNKGQDEEWLACGVIPMSAIVNVWPFDGEKLHMQEGDEVIVSADNQDWRYDWAHKIWRSAWEMSCIKKALGKEARKKRTASDNDQIPDIVASKRLKTSDASEAT
jgi:hypothetical protein